MRPVRTSEDAPAYRRVFVFRTSPTMDQPAPPLKAGSALPLPRWEFISLAAALVALNALAIDMMLPGLQQIGASLGVDNENHRQYVISAYISGFGLAQLAYGPISDRFGRRGPLLVGLRRSVRGWLR